MDFLIAALAEHGILGLIAGASLAAVAWMTRRYISHLEASEERGREALDRVGARLDGLSRAISDHEAQDATRHAVVVGRIETHQAEVRTALRQGR